MLGRPEVRGICKKGDGKWCAKVSQGRLRADGKRKTTTLTPPAPLPPTQTAVEKRISSLTPHAPPLCGISQPCKGLCRNPPKYEPQANTKGLAFPQFPLPPVANSPGSLENKMRFLFKMLKMHTAHVQNNNNTHNMHKMRTTKALAKHKHSTRMRSVILKTTRTTQHNTRRQIPSAKDNNAEASSTPAVYRRALPM